MSHAHFEHMTRIVPLVNSSHRLHNRAPDPIWCKTRGDTRVQTYWRGSSNNFHVHGTTQIQSRWNDHQWWWMVDCSAMLNTNATIDACSVHFKLVAVYVHEVHTQPLPTINIYYLLQHLQLFHILCLKMYDDNIYLYWHTSLQALWNIAQQYRSASILLQNDKNMLLCFRKLFTMLQEWGLSCFLLSFYPFSYKVSTSADLIKIVTKEQTVLYSPRTQFRGHMQ